MDINNPWDDGYDPSSSDLTPRPIRPACGGVRFEEDKSKSSPDWGAAFSTVLGIGSVAIIGHLINIWWR